MANLPLPPPPLKRAPAIADATPEAFEIESGAIACAKRILLYGPAKIGKTTLASKAPTALFADIEGGSRELDVRRIKGLTSWENLRAATRAVPAGSTLIIDTATKAEELALTWTLANVPHEKGGCVARIEDYGFGKGYQHLHDTWIQLLADLDRAIERGVNCMLIAHECATETPNPDGEDFLRHEPRLQLSKSGKASIREKTIEWADRVIYVALDVATKDGKGRGQGTRTIYCSGLPTHIAGVRGKTLPPRAWNDPNDGSIWKELL